MHEPRSCKLSLPQARSHERIRQHRQSRRIAQRLAGRDVLAAAELIGDAHPDLEEDWKWDTAVWTNKGNVCALGVFKEHLKVNFFKGALLDDPKELFNAGLEAKQSRSIDLHEGDKIDERALQDLVRAAAEYKPGRKR